MSTLFTLYFLSIGTYAYAPANYTNKIINFKFIYVCLDCYLEERADNRR
jgi:hypothetical protein